MSRWCNRHPAIVAAAFSVALLVVLVARAASKPLEHDEIITLVIADLPSLAEIRAAHLDGLDLTPPLYSTLAHAAGLVGGTSPVVIRLPAMLGFWLMTLCVFEIVRRRSSVVTALAAVLLIQTGRASYYATEARSFGPMLGLFALALFCWSEAAAGRHRRVHIPLLAAALGVGLWNHYFAFLAFVPIVIGELVRTARTRRSDWHVWSSIAAGVAAALPLAPLADATRRHAASFWSQAELSALGSTYDFILGRALRMEYLIPAALAALVIVPGVRAGRTRLRLPRTIPAHELAAVVATTMIPAIGLLAALVSFGAFAPRYVITGAIGVAIAAPMVVWRLGPPSGRAEGILCLALAVFFVQSGYQALAVAGSGRRNPIDERPGLAAALAAPRPLAVTGTLFLTTWYYAPPEVRSRLVYVADPVAATRLSGSDTIDRGYLVLRRWMAIGIEDYGSFIAGHPSFSLYTQGEFEWLPQRLRGDGATLLDVGHEGLSTIYDVRWEGESH